MKVAIVHDWLNQWGGAERVLEALHQVYPQAPIFTSLCHAEALPHPYRQWDIRPSFMQALPWAKEHHQPFLPFYPLAFSRLNLAGFDVVISNSSGFCHGVSVSPGTCHINYCLTPPRFLWSPGQYLKRERVHPLARLALSLAIPALRRWDAARSQGVHYFVGISHTVVERIRRCYHREADLIYPPVDTSLFHPLADRGGPFLIVSRLVPYKRVDLAVQAFNELGLPLIVIGEGRDRPALEAMAKPNVRFVGRLPAPAVVEALARCRAFIFPGEEDFGIAPVEALASGRPVIAYKGGGALDTVEEGITGRFFYPQTAQALVEVVRAFKEEDFDPWELRRRALAFDVKAFKDNVDSYVREKWAQFPARCGVPGAALDSLKR
ncbi:MAG: glycosyltransferase [Chloroflexi bacterium]|nr:glycosyltransferase [Chloroflexota bacterium]